MCVRHAVAQRVLRKKRSQLLLFQEACRIDDSVNR